MYRITNRVYTADVEGQPCKGSWYKPPTKRFRAGILRTTKGTVLMYPNGKAIVNKCRKKKDIFRTIALCAKAGVKLTKIKLVNIAAAGDVGHRIRLDRLEIPKRILEPELHPGLLFYVANVSVIVYHTGKIMFVGNRSYAQLRYTIRYIDRFIK